MKVLKHIEANGKNRRIFIALIHNEKEDSYMYLVKTRRLVDAATRNIMRSENVYTLETFYSLTCFFVTFSEDLEVYNLLNDKRNIPSFDIKTDLLSLLNKSQL